MSAHQTPTHEPVHSLSGPRTWAVRPAAGLACIIALAACGDATAPAAPAYDDQRGAAAAGGLPATPGTMTDVVLAWNDVITAFFHPPIFVPGQPPPADARGYAMASVAIHDVLNAIDRRYEPYAYTAIATGRVSGDAAVAAAVHGVLAHLGSGFSTPGPLTFVNGRYTEALAAIPDGAEKEAGIALGQAVATAVIAARAGDGSVGPPALPYVSAGGPGAFRPLIPDPSATALAGVAGIPYWANVRPFVIASGSQFRAAAPYDADSPADAVLTPQYLADYAETKALGGVVSQRTPDQTEIGLFWIESSALGWNRVARTILERRPQNAWRTARILALVHIAMADAYIAIFDSKYYWKFWRPVTAIRLGNLDPATPGDPSWNPASVAAGLGGTPPVPEWPSGHAMAGAAAAEALKATLPGTTAFTMTSTAGSGVSRSYRSVDEAVTENNLSRIYVGYHWRAATTEGERLGRLIGRYVVEHSLRQTAGR